MRRGSRPHGATAPVAAAGGTPAGGLGTSAELIAEAARSVDGGAGVAVLVDLGSAVLTVKAMVAEGDELPDGARLVDAPFVEGAVAAVVTASAAWRPGRGGGRGLGGVRLPQGLGRPVVRVFTGRRAHT